MNVSVRIFANLPTYHHEAQSGRNHLYHGWWGDTRHVIETPSHRGADSLYRVRYSAIVVCASIWQELT
jgi:hypothetical protein